MKKYISHTDIAFKMPKILKFTKMLLVEDYR